MPALVFFRITVTSPQFKTTKLASNTTQDKPRPNPARRTDIWRPETSSLTRDELRAIVLRTLG